MEGLTFWVFGAKYAQPCPQHARHLLNLLAFSVPSWVWWLYLGLARAGNPTGSRGFLGLRVCFDGRVGLQALCLLRSVDTRAQSQHE